MEDVRHIETATTCRRQSEDLLADSKPLLALQDESSLSPAGRDLLTKGEQLAGYRGGDPPRLAEITGYFFAGRGVAACQHPWES